MMRKLLFLLCCVRLFYAVADQASSFDGPTQEYEILNEEKSLISCCSRFRLYGFYAPGTSPGVDTSYESIGALYFGKLKPGSLAPLLEVQQNFLNNGTYATNAGIGSRYMNTQKDKVFGINLFYDSRNCNFCHFHQIGAGIEYLTPYFDFRFNGYMPVNGPFYEEPIIYDNYIGDYIVISEFKEYAYRGFDFESGMHFYLPGNLCFYAGIGPYFLTSETSSTWGVQWRARCDLWSYIFGEVQITYDRIFNDRYRGYIGIEIPLDQFTWNKCCCWFYQPIRRQNIIPVDGCCNYQTNY